MAGVVSRNKKVRIFVLKFILKSVIHLFLGVGKDVRSTEEQSGA